MGEVVDQVEIEVEVDDDVVDGDLGEDRVVNENIDFQNCND